MSGGFNPVNLVSQAALAVATGGTSLVAQAMQQVVSAVVQELVQQIGQQLGLPQEIIDTAKGAAGGIAGGAGALAGGVGAALGGVSSALGHSAAQAGSFQREAQGQIDDFIQNQAAQTARQVAEEGSERNGNGVAGGKSAKGGSVLMKIALAIGAAMDKKVDRMADIADELGAMGKQTADNTSHYQELSAEMNALGQELKIVGEALNNALKSIGDASSTLARKQ